MSSALATIRDYNRSHKASPFTSNRKEIPRKGQRERTIVGDNGLGAPPDLGRIKANAREGIGAFMDAIKSSTDCPVWNMDTIEQVRWNLQGPIAPEYVAANFGARIDLFSSGLAPSGIDYVESTFAQPGQTQTYMITCYVGLHLEPEPLCFTVQGNAWTNPAAGVTTSPISPDVFTVNDQTVTGANTTNSLGYTPATQTYVHATLEWGWWANYAAWMLARAYNLRWKIGQHTNIMDEVARHTAYMPPSAQEGSASNSQIDTPVFVNRLNTRYTSPEIGSPLVFLRQNRIRLGSTTVGGGNVGIFTPSYSQNVVGATYGGMDLRSMLRGNSEFRKLTLPYLIKPGIPIGLYLQVNDPVQAAIMSQYLDVTYGTGLTPAAIYDAASISGNSGTGANQVGLEIALNQATPATLVPQQTPNETVVFKGGELKITLAVKGFEVTEDWYTVMQNDPTVRDVVMSECGIRMATQGA